MESYFYNFINLTSIDLTYLDTILTTDMNGMFMGSTSLTELNLSKFNTSNVMDMSFMFAGNLFGGSGAIDMNLTNIVLEMILIHLKLLI